MPTFEEQELKKSIKKCRAMITKGSKSFSLAAQVFGKETREAAFALYGWCRLCDDYIDGSIVGMKSENVSKKEQLKRLRDLTSRTEAAYTGQKMNDPVFYAFQYVTHKYQIPKEYPLDLLEGMAMDIRQDRYETIHDLMLYCYRVAGTVGLMMSHIMGVSSEKALLHASSLGKAMQLTNIIRDVMEDAAMGRVYLPMDWLKEFNVDPNHIQDPQYRPALAKVVKRVLSVADILYVSGDRGLKYLPWRAACAIASARRVYAEIGKRAQRLGAKAWDQRVVVPTSRKIFVMMRGVTGVSLSIPKRVFSPWHSTPINTVWRNS